MTQRDPGLQPERTALAWSRTALAVGVNALLALRAGALGNPWMIGLGAVLVMAAIGVWAYGLRRGRRLVRGLDLQAVPAAAMLATAGAGILACVAGVFAVLASLPGH